MTRQPDSTNQIRPMLEVCRPGSDDLADPALAEASAAVASDPAVEDLYSRLQKIDVAVAGALLDVSLPVGARQRLLARLESVPAPASVRHRRVRLWAFLVTGAVAASLVLAVGLFRRDPSVLTPSQAIEEAALFFHGEPASKGVLLTADNPPRGFPFSSALLPRAEIRWRRIAGLLKTTGVAFDMANEAGVRATLYVVNKHIDGLPDTPSSDPVHGTANTSVAAWQEGGRVYLLVVQGDTTAYQSFLDPPRWPVT